MILRLIFRALILSAVLTCGCRTAEPLSDSAQIQNVLNAFFDAHEERNYEKYSACFSADGKPWDKKEWLAELGREMGSPESAKRNREFIQQIKNDYYSQISIDGNKASMTVPLGHQNLVFEFIKENGAWKLKEYKPLRD
jgi:hypothetical protein